MRSCRTISTLLDGDPASTLARTQRGHQAVYFLWHFPSSYPESPLGTTLALRSPDFPPASLARDRRSPSRLQRTRQPSALTGQSHPCSHGEVMNYNRVMKPSSSPARVAHLRDLPAIHLVLAQPEIAALEHSLGHAALLAAVRDWLEALRQSVQAGQQETLDYSELAAQLTLKNRSSLRPVLNATGVVVHTNLGRAPLAEAALQAMNKMSRGYSSLEYDLEAGSRGSRHQHASALLRELTGAEDAAVVNNNAGAVLLTLSALAQGNSVIVSRGELVEIGGGFRIPDVMRQSGAALVEVGTTNRTRSTDYEAAIDDDTALLLKVHQSNFAQLGFIEQASLPELADLAHRKGLPLVYDAGSGLLLRSASLQAETDLSQVLKAGVDLVTFSGDKLLGGPQAGLIVGRADLLARVRRHPLMRALRPDKLSLAALNATLRLWRDAPEKIPVYGMIEASNDTLKKRAEALASRLKAHLQAANNIPPDDVKDALVIEALPCLDRVGGGSSPLLELQGWALRISGSGRGPQHMQQRLRERSLPVIARVEDQALWLHLRTIFSAQEESLFAALIEVLGWV